MPDSTSEHGRGAADPQQADPRGLTESAKYFEAERLEESRKRFASYSLWAGLLSLLLLLVPNPAPWLFGPVAIVLGIYALLRIYLQPAHYAGTFRALVGIGAGLVATAACRPWLGTFRYLHRRAVCESNLRAIGQGLRDYHHEWESFPPDLQTLIQSGHLSTGQWLCLIEDNYDESEPDFAYVVGLQPDDPEDWIWLYDDPANHAGRGGIILYLGGETEHLSPAEFQAQLQRFRDEYQRQRGRPPVILPSD
ncbi:MAG: hypothetical protein ACE5I3_02860 [Phycisphaerae bacterium]